MSNAQDLLSILGGAAANRPPPAGGAARSTNGTAETSILHFKAGKMNTTLKPNGKYLVEPDMRRGELHVVWTATPAAAPSSSGTTTTAAAGGGATGGHLKLEWKDRRTKTVVNTIPIFPEDDATFERVETGRDGDRVYLLQCGGGGNNNNNSRADSRHFFWMQDKDVDPDEDHCVKVNLFMSDYAEAATAANTITNASSTTAADGTAATGGAAGPGGMDNAELLRIMQGALGTQSASAAGLEGARTTTVPGSNSIPTANAGQVDALGNILENLGMPQPNGTPAGEHGSRERSAAAGAASGAEGGDTAGGTTAGGTAGGLTLADLQGAMAGLATASPPGGATAAPGASAAGPPLAEFASSDIIDESGILDDPAVVERLVALLPEGQRTEDKLRENIRSPQVAQCLQRLTSALVDEDGSAFNSIIANFQLDPSDGTGALLSSGNPIEAFLNCLVKDVERKEGVKNKKQKTDGEGGEGKEGEGGGGGDDSKEGGDGKGSGDGDVKMDES